MNIAYCINETFFHLFIASLKSLLAHNDVKKVYVLFKELNENCLNTINSFENVNTKFFLVRITDYDFGHYNNSIYGVEANFRLILPDIVNEDNILYLDADTIINGNLNSIFSLKSDYSLGAVSKLNQNSFYDHKKKIGLRKESKYFNSGVLLLNLKKLRINGLMRDALSLLRTNTNFSYPDQDSLNLVFENRYLRLDPVFNTTSDIFEIIENPLIIHFTGPYKPDVFLKKSKYKELYKNYASLKPKQKFILSNLSYLIYMLRIYLKKLIKIK